MRRRVGIRLGGDPEDVDEAIALLRRAVPADLVLIEHGWLTSHEKGLELRLIQLVPAALDLAGREAV